MSYSTVIWYFIFLIYAEHKKKLTQQRTRDEQDEQTIRDTHHIKRIETPRIETRII
jgi:hypothetical protein